MFIGWMKGDTWDFPLSLPMPPYLFSSFYELIYSLRVTFTLADLDRHPTDDGLVHARTSRNV